MPVPGLPQRTQYAAPMRDGTSQSYSMPSLPPQPAQQRSSLSHLGAIAARAAVSSFAGVERSPFVPQAGPSQPRTPYRGPPPVERPPLRYTPDGYALSSTAPDPSVSPVERPRYECRSCFNLAFQNATQLVLHKHQHVRCDYPDCIYEGIPSCLKLHKEDRHLIFEDGPRQVELSEEEQRLKGKSVAITGTSIRLDSPEAIDKWINERKKRYPNATASSKPVKSRPAASPYSQPPRQPAESRPLSYGRGQIRGRGVERGAPRGRGRGRGAALPARPAPPIVPAAPASDDDSSSSSEDDEAAPETVSSKREAEEPVAAPPAKRPRPVKGVQKAQMVRPAPKAAAPRPARPSASPPKKDSLMAKLLAMEIEHDMSDLAQVVDFLLVNDCLRGVELKPGEEEERVTVTELPT